jgi:Protein of unknown function (DUF3105)
VSQTDPPVDPAPDDGRVGPTDDELVTPAADGSPSRLVLVLSVGLSALVLGLALAAPGIAALAGIEDEPPDLSEVEVFEITDMGHSDEDLAYPQTPPVGGPHHPVWLDCGHYEQPVREENVVHDLEHGTVWITYDPDLGTAAVERLLEQLPDNGILSPHDDLPSPVVVTVWGARLALDGADDERLALFLAEYGDGHTAPEFGVTCHGGTPDPTGEVPEPGVVT